MLIIIKTGFTMLDFLCFGQLKFFIIKFSGMTMGRYSRGQCRPWVLNHFPVFQGLLPSPPEKGKSKAACSTPTLAWWSGLWRHGVPLLTDATAADCRHLLCIKVLCPLTSSRGSSFVAFKVMERTMEEELVFDKPTELRHGRIGGIGPRSQLKGRWRGGRGKP